MTGLYRPPRIDHPHFPIPVASFKSHTLNRIGLS